MISNAKYFSPLRPLSLFALMLLLVIPSMRLQAAESTSKPEASGSGSNETGACEHKCQHPCDIPSPQDVLETGLGQNGLVSFELWQWLLKP